MSACRALLRRFIRRWVIYLTVGMLLLGGAGGATLPALKGLAAGAVAPLYRAVEQGASQAMGWALAYAIVGILVVWAQSPLLWPSAWREAERCLPLDHRLRRRSDAVVVGWAITPMLGMISLGSAVWFVQWPTWFREVWGRGLILWIIVLGTTWLVGMSVLDVRRRGDARTGQGRFRTARHASAGRVSPWIALVALALLRGRARRSARHLILMLASLWTCAVALYLSPSWAPWWLAACAAIGQVFVTRLQPLMSAEWSAFEIELQWLPWPEKGLWVLQQRTVIGALMTGWCPLVLALMASGLRIKPGVLVAFGLVNLVGPWMLIRQSWATSRSNLPDDPAARVAWWVLTLVTSVALASEVVR